MKLRRIIISPVLWSLLLTSPGWSAEPGSAFKATLVDIDAPEVAEVRQLGENAINQLANTLVREVNTALAKGGAEGAVDTCHLQAVPIVKGTLAGLPRITAMKRTSLRLRSPANAPDPAEQLVLEYIRQEMENGENPPPLLVQRVENPPAAPEWRVYKPLGVMPKCLACHGDPAEQSAALQAKLSAHYPADQATGYKAGQWRGLMRVTVADAPGK
jgi:Protein of unknown function (DUF3365)